MKRQKATVIQQVQEEIKAADQQVQNFRQLPDPTLRYRPTPDQWSVLDCLEHINLMYADYLPRLQAAIAHASPTHRDTYSPGFWGQKMIRGQRPKQGRRNMKMKTFNKMNPLTDHKTSDQIFDTFFRYHAQLGQLLHQSEALDWNQVKVASAIGPLLRFKLGDCFQALMAHTERHLLQGQEVLQHRDA